MNNYPIGNTPGAYVAAYLTTETHSSRTTAVHHKMQYLTGLEGAKQLTDNPATAMTYSSTEAAEAALTESGLPFGTVARSCRHIFDETTYTGGAALLVDAIEYHRGQHVLTLKGSIK